MNNFKFAGVELYDINNGKEFGVTLFVQGCPHHCPGCHNPQTWDFNSGSQLSADIINKIMSVCKNPNIRRLTISGGEPFANYEVTYSIASLFKNENPNKKLWIYTGYTFEELQKEHKYNSLFMLIDVLVDGPYQKNDKDSSLPFRGSSNQRIIDMARTRERGEVILLEVE